MNKVQKIINEKTKNNIKDFSLNLHFIDVKKKQPSKSGCYYVYTQSGAIQTIEYSKKYNLWNAMDDYIENAFNNDMVLYWIDDMEMNGYRNNKNKKNNKIEMTFGEIASKLLLAYCMGKLNEDKNELNKIVSMGNKELTKNLVDKGQLIDWD